MILTLWIHGEFRWVTTSCRFGVDMSDGIMENAHNFIDNYPYMRDESQFDQYRMMEQPVLENNHINISTDSRFGSSFENILTMGFVEASSRGWPRGSTKARESTMEERKEVFERHCYRVIQKFRNRI